MTQLVPTCSCSIGRDPSIGKLERRLDRIEKSTKAVFIFLTLLWAVTFFMSNEAGFLHVQITLWPHFHYYPDYKPYNSNFLVELNTPARSMASTTTLETKADTVKRSRLQSRTRFPAKSKTVGSSEIPKSVQEALATSEVVHDGTLLRQYPIIEQTADHSIEMTANTAQKKIPDKKSPNGRDLNQEDCGTWRKSTTSRGFKCSKRETNKQEMSKQAERKLSHSPNSSNSTKFKTSFTSSRQGLGRRWIKIGHSSPKCTEDVIWNGDLFSPVSIYTNYRFDQRIFELSQIATSVSGSHDLWSTVDRRQALCWLLHDDQRHVSSNDIVVVERYTIAVLFYAMKFEHGLIGGQLTQLRGKNTIYNVNLTNDQAGHLQRIEILSDNVFSGTLPHEVFPSLKYLSSVAMNNQKVYGTIPSDIGLTKNLEKVEANNNYLTGSIPSEIGRMTALKELHLDGNKLGGTIPAPLFATNSNLTTIVLANNQLEGGIPHEIGNAVNLTWIDFKNNLNLNGTIPVSLFANCVKLKGLLLQENSLTGTLPEEIGNLEHLRDVALQKNRLSGSLPSGLGHLPAVKYLILDYNAFSSVASDIIYSSNLKVLQISNNRLKGNIPSMKNIGNFTREMMVLDLSGNFLEGPIPSSLWSPSFEELKLPSNSLRGQVPSEFCNILSEGRIIVDDSSWMRQKPQIQCGCCNSCDEGGKQSNCRTIGNNNNSICPHDYATNDATIYVSYADDFEIIDIETGRIIDQRYLHDNNYYNFLKELDRETTLPVMGCYEARFYTYPKGRGCKESFCANPFEIKSQGKILAQNSQVGGTSDKNITVEFGLAITGPDRVPMLEEGRCDPVPDICNGISFKSGTQARRMLNHLSHYGLMGQNISVLFDLDNPPRRRALCFAVNTTLSNKLTNEELEENICTGQLLQQYVLALLMFNNHAWESNKVLRSQKTRSGFLPYCQWPGITCAEGRNSIVTGINLANKNCDGTLPQELSLLNGLESLVMKNNSLSGTIPHALPFRPLKKLDLSHNRLHGTLHDSFLDSLQNNLEELNLAHNLLDGMLTILSASEWDLKHLDLGSNFFTGTLQLGIFESMPQYIEYIDLSRNSLHGNISPHPFVHPYLETLSLHGNSFSGSIPGSIFTYLPNLTNLLLHSNRFTGSIPTEVGMTEQLTSLTLSHNSLKGTVPRKFEQLD